MNRKDHATTNQSSLAFDVLDSELARSQIAFSEEKDHTTSTMPLKSRHNATSDAIRPFEKCPTQMGSFGVSGRSDITMSNLLTWPKVQQLLRYNNARFQSLTCQNPESESYLIEISRSFPKLAVDRPVDVGFSEHGVLILEGGPLVHLHKAYVEHLCMAYFQSFHCICPIVDNYMASVKPIVWPIILYERAHIFRAP